MKVSIAPMIVMATAATMVSVTSRIVISLVASLARPMIVPIAWSGCKKIDEITAIPANKQSSSKQRQAACSIKNVERNNVRTL